MASAVTPTPETSPTDAPISSTPALSNTPTPTPPAAPTPSPTATPSPTPTPQTGLDIDEVAQSIEAQYHEFYEAILTEPEPDLTRLQATYSKTCQLDESVFVQRVDALKSMIEDAEVLAGVVAVSRVNDHAVMAVVKTVIDGWPTADRRLWVFEEGRWLDNNCAEGRAAVLQPAEADETPTPDAVSIPVSGDPSDYTDQHVARISESLVSGFFEEALAEEPDLDGLLAAYVPACRPDEEGLIAGLEQLRNVAESVAFEVVAVERIGIDKAWVTTEMDIDGQTVDLEPSLTVFENGRWMDSDCAAGREAALGTEYTSPAIGTPLVIKPDWLAPSFKLVVLGPPETVDDITVRLPIRIAAVTKFLDVEFISPWGRLIAEPDQDGYAREWLSYECEENAFEGVLLARMGSHEGYLCFESPDRTAAQDERFTAFWLVGDDDQPVSIDLTRSVGISDRDMFPPDVIWPEPPSAGTGSTITPTLCRGDPWVDLTVLGPLEIVGESTARLPVEVVSLSVRGEVSPGGLPLGLATRPDTFGRIYVWDAAAEAEDGSILPESFGDKSLTPGEKHRANVYFRAPDDEPGPPREPFVVLRFEGVCYTATVDLTGGE